MISSQCSLFFILIFGVFMMMCIILESTFQNYIFPHNLKAQIMWEINKSMLKIVGLESMIKESLPFKMRLWKYTNVPMIFKCTLV